MTRCCGSTGPMLGVCRSCGDGVVMPGLGLSPAVGLVATVQALRVAAGWGASRVRLWPVFDDAVRSPRDVAAARALLSTVEVVSANLGVLVGADDRAWWVPARRPPNTALFTVVGQDQASSVFDVGIAAANLSRSNPADDFEDPNQSGFVGFNNGGSLTKSSGGAVVVSTLPGGIDGPATLAAIRSASQQELDAISPVLIPGFVPGEHFIGKWRSEGHAAGNVSLGPWQRNPRHAPMSPLLEAWMLYQVLQEVRVKSGVQSVQARVGNHAKPLTVTGDGPPMDMEQLHRWLLRDEEFLRTYLEFFAPEPASGWTYAASAMPMVSLLFQGDEPRVDTGRLPVDPGRLRLVVFADGGGLVEAIEVAERTLRQLHVGVARSAVVELRLTESGAGTIGATWAMEVGKRWRRERLPSVEVHALDLDTSVVESGGTPMAYGTQTFPEWARTVQFPPAAGTCPPAAWPYACAWRGVRVQRWIADDP